MSAIGGWTVICKSGPPRHRPYRAASARYLEPNRAPTGARCATPTCQGGGISPLTPLLPHHLAIWGPDSADSSPQMWEPQPESQIWLDLGPKTNCISDLGPRPCKTWGQGQLPSIFTVKVESPGPGRPMTGSASPRQYHYCKNCGGFSGYVKMVARNHFPLARFSLFPPGRACPETFPASGQFQGDSESSIKLES